MRSGRPTSLSALLTATHPCTHAFTYAPMHTRPCVLPHARTHAEERLKKLMDEIKQSDDIILMIDEVRARMPVMQKIFGVMPVL
jgi:hypothetical protein